MMRRLSLTTRLLRDQTGAMTVEFALLAPAFFTMMLGVLQIGIAMQNYNAMRSLSADVARYAMVNYQTGNELSTSQIETFAENHALGAPYLLAQDRVNVIVTEPGTQRVTGATELQITATYQIDSLLGFAGIEFPFIRYTRPVFLLEE